MFIESASNNSCENCRLFTGIFVKIDLKPPKNLTRNIFVVAENLSLAKEFIQTQNHIHWPLKSNLFKINERNNLTNLFGDD